MKLTAAIVTAALVAIPAAAAAQVTAPPMPTPEAKTAPAVAANTGKIRPASGVIDFGFRTTDLTGDGARYERYRDLGDGAFLDAARAKYSRGNWLFDAGANNLGRRDQRFEGVVSRPGLFNAWAIWDQIPMLMSRTTSTLYTTVSPGVFRINDSIQSALQSATAAQQTALMTNFVKTQSTVFNTESRRHIGDTGVEYRPDAKTSVRFEYKATNREGVIPYGGTFGFSNAIELPVPVNHNMSDLAVNAERAEGRWLFRAGYARSEFTNEVQSIVWDNPYRLTDSATVPSQGRTALAPNNLLNNVNGTVSVRLPKRSWAMAYVSIGVLDDQGTTILPHTINAALPVIALNRATVDGHATTKTTMLTFSSRPAKPVSVNVKYRYYDFINGTPVFTNTSRVGYDTSVQTVNPPSETPRYGGARQSLDADVTVRRGVSSFGAGYSLKDATYEERIFESSSEHTARLTYDAFSSRWFTLHSKYEHAIRRGHGLDTTEIAADGEQPGMRTFDIADRDRDTFTMTGSITPVSTLVFSVSAGKGQDKYPHSQFGLFNAKRNVYSMGVDATPMDNVSFGVSYEMEDFRTLQWSRQANPGVQFLDASRDWSTDGHDRVHSVVANLDVTKIANHVDLRASYDFNRGRTLYLYGLGSVVDRTLPEGSTDVPTTLPPPTQLPEVFSQLQRGTLDGVYNFTSRVGVGMTFWYERYKVDDFALDAEALPQINLPSALLLGYQYLPYTARTVFGRLIVRW